MSFTVTLDPETTDLLTAVGLIDADGRLSSEWFQDPIGAVRRIVADAAEYATERRFAQAPAEAAVSVPESTAPAPARAAPLAMRTM